MFTPLQWLTDDGGFFPTLFTILPGNHSAMIDESQSPLSLQHHIIIFYLPFLPFLHFTSNYYSSHSSHMYKVVHLPQLITQALPLNGRSVSIPYLFPSICFTPHIALVIFPLFSVKSISSHTPSQISQCHYKSTLLYSLTYLPAVVVPLNAMSFRFKEHFYTITLNCLLT